MHPFFFRELQLITILLLFAILIQAKNKFISLKVCLEFFIFDYVLFLLKFLYLFNKKHGLFSLALKPHIFFKT